MSNTLRLLRLAAGIPSPSLILLEGLMTREVKIGNTTFFVNCFSRKDATETVEQLMKRVIVRNAEKVFRDASLLSKKVDESSQKRS